MTSRHLIDPELLKGFDAIPAMTFSAETLPAIREAIGNLMGAVVLESTTETISEAQTIPTEQGHRVEILIHTPRTMADPRPAVLYIHGGGYIIGTARMFVLPNQTMAAEADCVVVAVDYRLAPDTPHPGAIEDCYTALKHIHDNADALGVDPTRIAVAGESAGGGLAAALALLARDRGEVPIVHQHLIYPMIDDRTCITADPHPFAGEFVWTAESNHFGWSSLLGREPGGADVSPYAAAARAEDLSGLPSAFIAVGALDLFAEEDIEYARRLMRAGVPTELHVYPGAYHGFEAAGDAEIVRRAHHNSMAALRRALH